MHVLHNILPWPNHQRKMLVDNPAGIVSKRGELLAENSTNLGRFNLLSFKYQFRRRASSGVDRASKPACRPLKRHAVCPLKGKAARETTAERAQQERRRNGANKQNPLPRIRPRACYVAVKPPVR